MNYNKTFILFLFFLPVFVLCQNAVKIEFPGLPVPQSPVITPGNMNPFNQTNPYNPQIDLHTPVNTHQRNEALIRQIEEYEAYLNSQKTQNERDADYLTKNGFPFIGNNPEAIGTEHFYNAFDTLHMMLDGVVPLHLGKAIFLVENAYYSGTFKYRL